MATVSDVPPEASTPTLTLLFCASISTFFAVTLPLITSVPLIVSTSESAIYAFATFFCLTARAEPPSATYLPLAPHKSGLNRFFLPSQNAMGTILIGEVTLPLKFTVVASVRASISKLPPATTVAFLAT